MRRRRLSGWRRMGWLGFVGSFYSSFAFIPRVVVPSVRCLSMETIVAPCSGATATCSASPALIRLELFNESGGGCKMPAGDRHHGQGPGLQAREQAGDFGAILDTQLICANFDG